STFHFMGLLDLTALYLQATRFGDTWGGEQGKRMQETGLLLGYLFQIRLAGWRQFCAEHQFEPELCWQCLPGLDRVKEAEELAEAAAFTEEEALRYVQQKDAQVNKVRTAEDVAADSRASLKARRDWWE